MRRTFRNLFWVICLPAHFAVAGEPTFFHRLDGGVTVVDSQKNFFGDTVVSSRGYSSKQEAYSSEYGTEIAVAGAAIVGLSLLYSYFFEPSQISQPQTLEIPQPAWNPAMTGVLNPLTISETPKSVLPQPEPVLVKPNEIFPLELQSKPDPRVLWKTSLQKRKEASDTRFDSLMKRHSSVAKSEVDLFNTEVRAAEREREEIEAEINDFNAKREVPTQFR